MPASTEARANLRDALASLSLVAVCTVLLVAHRAPERVSDPASCELLFDRWAELSLRVAEPGASGSELEQRKRRARALAEERDAYLRCVEEADAAALRCTEQAHDIDALERCFP